MKTKEITDNRSTDEIIESEQQALVNKVCAGCIIMQCAHNQYCELPVFKATPLKLEDWRTRTKYGLKGSNY